MFAFVLSQIALAVPLALMSLFRTWCRSDPVIEVDPSGALGPREASLTIYADAALEPYLTGGIAWRVNMPTGASGTITLNEQLNGYDETVNFQNSSGLQAYVSGEVEIEFKLTGIPVANESQSCTDSEGNSTTIGALPVEILAEATGGLGWDNTSKRIRGLTVAGVNAGMTARKMRI